jgi:hypothetical protein
VTALIEQLFDVSSDPGAKQRLLGGVSNFAACRACGFSGPLATPIVYHDTEKELLLTYFPGELNVPLNEQEKLVGPLIKQATERLPAEKRKGYLLQPRSFLTYQSLIEHILGADGITPEMIAAQQKRVGLVERLLAAASPAARSEIIKQESASFDADFFAIFSRLVEGAVASGQERYVQDMDAIQKQLLEETEYGRKLSSQANEIQEAVRSLQSVGKELDRTKLLEILIEAPNEDRLGALVSMTRPALDYVFFQSLTERIEAASGAKRKKLEALRTRLLDLTREIDQRLEAEYQQAVELLESLLQAEDVKRATAGRLQEINDTFVQVLNRALQEANQKNDAVRMPKLQQVVEVLQSASAPPPELALLQELLQAADEAALSKLLEERAAQLTPEFASVVASVLARTEEQAGKAGPEEDPHLLEKLQRIYRLVLKASMKKSMG